MSCVGMVAIERLNFSIRGLLYRIRADGTVGIMRSSAGGTRSGRAPFLHDRLQITLQRILIRRPQHPVALHQAFGAGLAQSHLEALWVLMVAQLIPPQAPTLG